VIHAAWELADDQDLLALVAFEQLVEDRELLWRRRRHPVALPGLGDGVGHPPLVAQLDPHLGADGRSDPAERLELLPTSTGPATSPQRVAG